MTGGRSTQNRVGKETKKKHSKHTCSEQLSMPRACHSAPFRGGKRKKVKKKHIHSLYPVPVLHTTPQACKAPPSGVRIHFTDAMA